MVSLFSCTREPNTIPRCYFDLLYPHHSLVSVQRSAIVATAYSTDHPCTCTLATADALLLRAGTMVVSGGHLC